VSSLVTCPGFPGYCSESYVGDTCTVVCARGRNNVPQCQSDGSWTDVPRCIEHEPGIEEQLTGICPGIPGYCSLDLPGALCEFACPVGPPIRSSCTEDGTWEPYPTCTGDPRETQDGCNPCPGPDGPPRNRTLEAAAPRGGGGANRRPAAANRGNNNNNNNNNNNRRGGGGGGNRNTGNIPRNNANNRGSNRNGNNRQNNRGNGGNGGQRNQNNGGRGGQQNQNHGGSFQAKQSNSNNRRVEVVAEAETDFQQPRSFGGNQEKGAVSTGVRFEDKSSGQCPGEELQACIDVCPGFSARVFGACVAGCAKRCPAKK